MDWRIIADLAVGTAIPLLFMFLYALRKVTGQEVVFFITGFLIGTTFEFFIWYMGPSFFYVRMEWPLPWPTYYLCHSFWDAGLFMGGYYLTGIILKKPYALLYTHFDWRELAVISIWGIVTSCIVELSGNGIIWQYIPHRWNPVWITVGKQSYTLFIQVVWIVSPVIFYLICLSIRKRDFSKK
ncbi:MAG: hypothetical protein IPM95_12095 [Sphingobacteriales bacterium]|nr:hypothetical protein [Sphingobacteriales bacterium]